MNNQELNSAILSTLAAYPRGLEGFNLRQMIPANYYRLVLRMDRLEQSTPSNRPVVVRWYNGRIGGTVCGLRDAD